MKREDNGAGVDPPRGSADEASPEASGGASLGEPPTGRSSPSRWSYAKDVTGTIQSIVTVIAFLVAGLWFFAQRETQSRATIAHRITHRQLSSDYTWVHAFIRITNIGRRRLHLQSGTFWLEKILPVETALREQLERGESLVRTGKGTVEWPRISPLYEPALNRSLEPGEDDEVECEFIIPSTVRTVKLYTYFANDPTLGWPKSTVYEIVSDQERRVDDETVR